MSVERFGPASLTAAIVSMCVLDQGSRQYAYVVTRGQTPPVLAEIDLDSRVVTRTARLERGDGAWAATTSGGMVYVGTYPHPDIYRFDPATGEVERIGTIGPDSNGYVWTMCTAPDGTVYAGTYPRGEVWSYDPSSGELKNLGAAAAGETYVRGIAADDTHVYAGTIPAGHLVAYDRATGEKQELLSTLYGGISVVATANGRVIASIGKRLVDVAKTGGEPTVIPVPDVERVMDAMTVTADGTLYTVGRPSGTVYRRVGDALEPVAAPVTGDEHRAIVPLDETTLLGAAGSGVLWWLDILAGTSEVVDLIEAGLSGPEPAQSMAHDPDGLVYVGGHFALTVHRPEDDLRERFRVAGEPKSLRVVKGRVYAALYPSTEILSLDPGSGGFHSYGFIRNEQLRPTHLVYSAKHKLFLISTAPAPGRLKGGLTLMTEAGEMTVYPDVLVDQAVLGVAVAGDVAYLAGDTFGGGSVTPARPSATVGAFSLATRELLWEQAPVEDFDSIEHLAVLHNVLYGIYRRPAGEWFTMHLPTRTVFDRGKLPGTGELTVHRGHVYASVLGGSVYLLGPCVSEPRLILDGLGTGWYNRTQVHFEATSWWAWTMADRDLARAGLDPRPGSA